MIERLTSYTFEINKGGLTPQERYPQLIGQPFNMSIVTKSNEIYTVSLMYNHASESLVICVYNGTEVIQGNTGVQSYPSNLLLCNELNDYALYYDNIDSVFHFCYVKDFYNFKHGLDYWQMLDYLKQGVPQ